MTPAELLEYMEENNWLHDFKPVPNRKYERCANCGACTMWDGRADDLCLSAKVDIRIFPLEETKVERGIEL